ncbi:MAG: DEAD/DEAH box helicase [Candidatus Poribacteria bacterium]|nr:DEAD/DEAH box helicase [Candidatus Poribacteria bacterium]
MIKLEDFVLLLRQAILRFEDSPPNQSQEACIVHPTETPLMIVAGPGSGKTTVLVLRALRLVFVDGFRPEEILITTFTRKAAAEIRARLIEWGSSIIHCLKNSSSYPIANSQNQLDSIDLNQFITGTLDSICNDVLKTIRSESEPVPAVVEGFVNNALFRNYGLFPAEANNNNELAEYLSDFTFGGRLPRNFKETLNICRTIIDRFVQDQVDLHLYQQVTEHNEARRVIVNAFESYREYMDEHNQVDYARLEEVFYKRLVQGKFDERFASNLKALLVDEYQDTNPLQESIYFELVRRSGASLAIVGDDDQSLYRFRGATVELFRDFISRFNQDFDESYRPETKYLVENYRSTPEIVKFFNNFITNDPDFAPARVHSSKPRIIAQRYSNQMPVLGMFRSDQETLADNLASFLIDVFRRDGYHIEVGGQQYPITKNRDGGDFGDSVFLSHTVNEFTSSGKERLPFLLRQRLEQRGISAFNPRGRSLRDIPVVQQLLGIILECIDPESEQQNQLNRLRREAETYLNRWRRVAQNFVETEPIPNQPTGISDFIQSWKLRKAQRLNRWPNEWPLLDLCFAIITWIPQLHNDPEGQVYIEAVARCISSAAIFSSYRSKIFFDQPQHEERSIQSAIREILAPIAEGDVDIDEDIMPHVPRSHFPFMTIHQAKGLEYPLVIVDVASDYKTNHHTQRFRRFPEEPSSVQNLENDLASSCEIGKLRMNRGALPRTFDDLIRLYYVAYSRPQSILLLVGLDSCLSYSTNIKHVAMGWRSNSEWSWKSPVGGKDPVQANNVPLHLIWE